MIRNLYLKKTFKFQ